MTDDDYDAAADMSGSIEECYRAIRERVARGGPGFDPERKPPESAAGHGYPTATLGDGG